MTFAKGIIGYALYMEERKDGKTQQFIWTPPVVDREAHEFVGPKMLNRTISDLSRRKKWRYTDLDATDLTYNSSTGQIDQIVDLDDAVAALRETIKSISHSMKSSRQTGWSWTGEPIIVEVTQADARSFRLYSTPDALNRRINAARTDANYPEVLWDAS